MLLSHSLLSIVFGNKNHFLFSTRPKYTARGTGCFFALLILLPHEPKIYIYIYIPQDYAKRNNYTIKSHKDKRIGRCSHPVDTVFCRPVDRTLYRIVHETCKLTVLLRIICFQNFQVWSPVDN